MNDTTDKPVVFTDAAIDVLYLSELLGVIRAHGVQTFACAQFSVRFADAAPVVEAPALEPEKQNGRGKEDEDALLFSAVGG